MAESTDRDTETTLVSTFRLGNALFGADTLRVQEVVLVGDITPVHHAPDHIRGVINLRGRIVTIVDLARKLGLERPVEPTDGRIMIVEWKGEYVGLLVDGVADVFPAEREKLAPPPANIGAAQAKYFEGICRTDKALVALLSIDAVLDVEES